jgi:hypothetical protein
MVKYSVLLNTLRYMREHDSREQGQGEGKEDTA